jgi:hypothetical protein
MKKVLSIVLSIAMVVCLMPSMSFAASDTSSDTPAATETTDTTATDTTGSDASGTGEVDGRQAFKDIDGLKCEGAVNVLNAVGVVNGFPDGTFRPGEDVTRAHMAQMITKALNIEAYANATTSIFSDMGSATWAIPQVEYCAQLGIVKGYGDGTFGPNDLVTYEQAATMLVRAIGYTDDCNEMISGVWPANYVQKALDLGIFADTANGGTKTANRGDVSIMVFNALNIPQVYIDNDGVTQYRNGSEQFVRGGHEFYGTSMLYTLNKDGDYEYGIITKQNLDDSVADISNYLGAVAKIYTDKDDKVLAIGDIQTSLLTGTFNVDFDQFTTLDGTKYSIGDDPIRTLQATDGEFKIFKSTWGYAPFWENAVPTNTFDRLTGTAAQDTLKGDCIPQNKRVVLAVKVSGSTITQIYSANCWDPDYAKTKMDVLEESDVNNIKNNKSLFGEDFLKDYDGQPDEKTFELVGVDSLDDISEDNVVAIYADNNDKIRRVEVGSEKITGVVESFSTGSASGADNWGKPGSIVIDGKTYKTAYNTIAGNNNASAIYDWVDSDSDSDVKVGDEVEAYLDADGAVWRIEISSASSSNYALVLDYDIGNANYEDETVIDGYGESTIRNDSGLNGSSSCISVMTSTGSVVTLNFKDKATLINDDTADTRISVGDIVTYDLNSANRIRKVRIKGKTNISFDATNLVSTTAAVTNIKEGGNVKERDVTKKGYWDGTGLSDSVVVFAIDRLTRRIGVDVGVYIPMWYIDDDDVSIGGYDNIVDTEDVLGLGDVIKNTKISAFAVNGQAVSKSKNFGFITGWTELPDDDSSNCAYRITALINGESNTYYADLDSDSLRYAKKQFMLQFKFNTSGYVTEILKPYDSTYGTGGEASYRIDTAGILDMNPIGFAIAGYEIDDGDDQYNRLGRGITIKNGTVALFDAETGNRTTRAVDSSTRYYEWKGGNGSVSLVSKSDIESADNSKIIVYLSVADDDDDADNVIDAVIMYGKTIDDNGDWAQGPANMADYNGVNTDNVLTDAMKAALELYFAE